MLSCVSRIAWAGWGFAHVQSLLSDAGVDHIEITPNVPLAELGQYVACNFSVESLQSILYQSPDSWVLGKSDEQIEQRVDSAFWIARQCRAAVMVYGSPKTRVLDGRTPGGVTAMPRRQTAVW